jgi:hypothetical protein
MPISVRCHEGDAAMPTATVNEALKILTDTIPKFDADELVEIYNDVFRKDQRTVEEARKDPSPLIARLVDYIHSREVSSLPRLWNLIFPAHINVWYNEEDEQLYYNEETIPGWPD